MEKKSSRAVVSQWFCVRVHVLLLLLLFLAQQGCSAKKKSAAPARHGPVEKIFFLGIDSPLIVRSITLLSKLPKMKFWKFRRRKALAEQRLLVSQTQLEIKFSLKRCKFCLNYLLKDNFRFKRFRFGCQLPQIGLLGFNSHGFAVFVCLTLSKHNYFP